MKYLYLKLYFLRSARLSRADNNCVNEIISLEIFFLTRGTLLFVQNPCIKQTNKQTNLPDWACRNYKSYMRCVAPYKESCIQNKERLQDIGSESLSSVVVRMETLYQYVSLLCEDHYEGTLSRTSYIHVQQRGWWLWWWWWWGGCPLYF